MQRGDGRWKLRQYSAEAKSVLAALDLQDPDYAPKTQEGLGLLTGRRIEAERVGERWCGLRPGQRERRNKTHLFGLYGGEYRTQERQGGKVGALARLVSLIMR